MSIVLSYIYSDDYLRVLLHAKSQTDLEIFEFLHIHVHRPVLRVQKQFVTPMH